MSEIFANPAIDWNNKISLSSKKYLLIYLAVNVALVFILQAFLMGVLFFAPANAQIFNQNNLVAPTPTLQTTEILNIVNQTRVQYNLDRLVENEKLQMAAQAKADYLLTEQLFSHSGKNGEPFSTWIKQYDYNYLRVGENLAIFFTDNQAIVNAWLASEAHRKNILNPYYTETGLAVKQGYYQGKSTYLVVQIFGQPTK